VFDQQAVLRFVARLELVAPDQREETRRHSPPAYASAWPATGAVGGDGRNPQRRGPDRPTLGRCSPASGFRTLGT
jgi:hypothetical protein